MPNLFQRLFRSNQEIASEELQRSSEAAGANSIGSLVNRQEAEIRGTISRLKLNPRQGTPWLEACLDDGSGSITLIWMGRRSITGIVPGRTLKVSGRVVDCGSGLCIYNPKYELVAE